jgi:hypothetical protein
MPNSLRLASRKVNPNPVALVLATVFLVSLLAVGGARAGGLPAAPTVRTDDRGAPEAKIDDARRALEQAAAEAEFASDTREIALLQRARNDLSAAIDHLGGLQRQRTQDLLNDLNQAMQRTGTKLGRLVSPGAEGFGPLVPSRQMLNGLATEALELQRNAPELQRLPNTIVVDVRHRRQPVEKAAEPAPSPIELANQEPLSWPLGYEAAWPQIRFRF